MSSITSIELPLSFIESLLYRRLPVAKSKVGISTFSPCNIRAISKAETLQSLEDIYTPSASTLDNLGVLIDRSIPVVLMDHPPISRALSTVSGDDVAGARAAIDHLVDLGHRRIGLVNGPLSVRQAADRREGVLAAIVEAGLDVAEVLEEVEVVVEGRAFRRRPPPNS